MEIFFRHKWKFWEFMIVFFENSAPLVKRINPEQFALSSCCYKIHFEYSILRAIRRSARTFWRKKGTNLLTKEADKLFEGENCCFWSILRTVDFVEWSCVANFRTLAEWSTSMVSKTFLSILTAKGLISTMMTVWKVSTIFTALYQNTHKSKIVGFTCLS